jgi:multiple sugar transport system substrate-binding protein
MLSEKRIFRSQFLRGGAALVGGSALLAACAQGGMAAPAAPAEGEMAKEADKPAMMEPTEISFLWPHYSAGKTRWLEWILETYNAKETGVTVNSLDVAGSFGGNPATKLRATVAGGTAPDMGWFGTGIHPFAGILYDANELLKGMKYDMSQLNPTLVNGLTWQGKLIAAPIGINTTAWFYNKDLFDKAGVPYPQDGDTFEDRLDAAQKVSSALSTSDEKIWGVATVHYVNYWIAGIYEGFIDDSGAKVLLNGPLGEQAVEWWRDNWDKYEVGPRPEDYNRQEDAQFFNSFANGKVAMAVYGTWGLEPIRRHEAGVNFDIVEQPTAVADGQEGKGAFFGIEEIFTVATTKKLDAAAEFLSFLVSPEHLGWTGGQGNIIPAIAPLAEEVFVPSEDSPDPANLLAFARAADYAKPWFPHPQYGELRGAFAEAMTPYWSEEATTAKQALELAQENCQVIVDDWNAANL